VDKVRKFKSKLIKVIDGDTIDAEIDLGFNVHIKKRVRLWQINAPETRSKNKQEVAKGKTAKRRLIEILDSTDGKFILVSHGLGKYGRCLGELYIKGEEKSVNQLLIDEGLVKEYNKK